ncbi:hypothetical protein RIF29_15503 [Crotalaria pallida]|uniref:Uncharacterized protein n=1 Tax=Crotalaria pallida TaxID=3830 RepID=A0AAN9ICN3_CROPI
MLTASLPISHFPNVNRKYCGCSVKTPLCLSGLPSASWPSESSRDCRDLRMLTATVAASSLSPPVYANLCRCCLVAVVAAFLLKRALLGEAFSVQVYQTKPLLCVGSYSHA